MFRSSDVIDNSPKTALAVLQALLDGEKLSESDPAETQAAVARIEKSRLSPDFIKAAWSSYQRKINLDEDIMNLIVKEGKWISERGPIKGVKSTRELYRRYFRDGPLRSLAADRVNLK